MNKIYILRLNHSLQHFKIQLLFFFVSTLILTLITSFSLAKEPDFLSYNGQWADSVMNQLTLEEKIGQLIMVTAYPQIKIDTITIKKQISKYGIGGVLFLKSTPHEQARLTNLYQSKSKIPLFIAMDAENGLSFRMDSTIKYPDAMALGAIENDSLIFRLGQQIGQQCKTIGVNMNFGPVADVNSNRNNPIINHRSFGENPENVGKKANLLAQGMTSEKILSCAKHFPGHGDTSHDSHHTLPVIKKTKKALNKVELVPFKMMIEEGIPMIMNAHLSIPSLNPNNNKPSSLSKEITHQLLKKELGFKGLVVSDAMNMKAITQNFAEGEAALQALLAGNDIIEFVVHPEVVIKAIKNGIETKRISEKQINEKCRKILLAKSWLNLPQTKPVDLSNLTTKLNHPKYHLLNEQLTEALITIIQNENKILPIHRLDTFKIATVAIGHDTILPFQTHFEHYTSVDHFTIPKESSPTQIQQLKTQLKNYNLIITGIIAGSKYGYKNYGITPSMQNAVNELCKNHHCINAFFGVPYGIKIFEKIVHSKSIIVSYNSAPLTQIKSAEIIVGAIKASGSISVSATNQHQQGLGFKTQSIGRFRYSIPEASGINADLLIGKVDSIAKIAIKEQTFPGCQILIAKNGNILFHHCYGYHTYDSITPVEKNHLYDWASITKITGPLPALMKLYDEKKYNLKDKLSHYDARLLNSNKTAITFEEVLTHQAGLKPWIPFWYEILKANEQYKKRFIRETPSKKFNIRIADHLYLRNNYKNTIIKEVIDSELLRKKEYKYSGLAFYLFPDIISTMSGSNYENYLSNNFYTPLGATSVCYNPFNHFPTSQFVPTEIDGYFRKTTIRGYVHDEGCALMGGISGNAGLFGTTEDLAKIMQMYLQKGNYGGTQFITSKTVDLFTSIQFPEDDNRRGLGFDKPYIDNHKNELKDAYPSPLCSAKSFGHSGFTGTFTWADPENGLLLVFMSNRVYPTRENNKIYDLNFRPELHEIIYKCLDTFSPKH